MDIYERLGDGKETWIDPLSSLVVINDAVVMPLKVKADDVITLYDVLETAKKHKIRIGTILVLYELGLRGEVYRYGNHGDFWEKIGVTVGYA